MKTRLNATTETLTTSIKTGGIRIVKYKKTQKSSEKV